jgi:hypothetical protein
MRKEYEVSVGIKNIKLKKERFYNIFSNEINIYFFKKIAIQEKI